MLGSLCQFFSPRLAICKERPMPTAAEPPWKKYSGLKWLGNFIKSFEMKFYGLWKKTALTPSIVRSVWNILCHCVSLNFVDPLKSVEVSVRRRRFRRSWISVFTLARCSESFRTNEAQITPKTPPASDDEKLRTQRSKNDKTGGGGRRPSQNPWNSNFLLMFLQWMLWKFEFHGDKIL